MHQPNEVTDIDLGNVITHIHTSLVLCNRNISVTSHIITAFTLPEEEDTICRNGAENRSSSVYWLPGTANQINKYCTGDVSVNALSHRGSNHTSIRAQFLAVWYSPALPAVLYPHL